MQTHHPLPVIFPVHHTTEVAKTADEEGYGHFNVIERSGRRFQVLDGDTGRTMDEVGSLRAAVRIARREARRFDLDNPERMIPGRAYRLDRTTNTGPWGVALSPTKFWTGEGGQPLAFTSKRKALAS